LPSLSLFDFVFIRKHGRLLEEGASGFLAGKLSISDGKPSNDSEASWNSFNQLIKSNKCSDNGFGSSNWASVYLASTPQQAASLGLNFPGVDEVRCMIKNSEITLISCLRLEPSLELGIMLR
jgi:hypothetical protein